MGCGASVPAPPPPTAAVESRATAAATGDQSSGSLSVVMPCGDVVPCVAEHAGIDAARCLASPAFQAWTQSVDERFLVRQVTFQSVDFFGPRVGFLKFRADCCERATVSQS
jgi:hypothetical protein